MKKECKAWRPTETIARLEQRNAIRDGKVIAMINTHVVQALSMKEKKEFFEYLREKGRVKKFLLLGSFLMFALFVSVKLNLTGNAIVIEEEIGGYLSILSISIFGLTILILLIIISREGKINRMFDEHVQVAETIFSGKKDRVFKGRSTKR
ncbi:MAG: hypothetical protein Q8L29_02755 [archaeon]|nr:hypothetical protein [archaeon]